MAYPTLEELLKAYQLQTQGPGNAIAAGREGIQEGANLAGVIQNRQALNEYRKQQLAEKMKEFQTNADIKQQQADTSKEKAEKPSKQYSIASGIQAPEGKVAVIDQSTGKVEYQDLPGAKTGKDVMSSYAKVRAQMALSNQLLQDPNYRKNQDIIDRGLRISNISSAKDVIDNPAQLHILNDLVVSQAEGGKASLAGVKRVGNETAQQFAARVMEKVTNQPESADTAAFVKQLKNISDQDMKSAYTSIDALARAKANGLKRIYPDMTQSIDDTANNFANDYVTGIFGGKKPEFLKGGGATGQETPSTPTSNTNANTNSTPIKTADDFLKKYGIK